MNFQNGAQGQNNTIGREDVLAAIESESENDMMANDSETFLESEEEVDKSTEDISANVKGQMRKHDSGSQSSIMM